MTKLASLGDMCIHGHILMENVNLCRAQVVPLRHKLMS